MSKDLDTEFVAIEEEQEDEGTIEEMCDLYRCYEHQDALRLVDLLTDNNIEALLRDRSTSAFPTNVGMTSQQIIAVTQADQAKAQEIIKAALSDEVVSSEGVFLQIDE